VIEGAPETAGGELQAGELARRVAVREEAGERRKEAIAAVAQQAGLPKREVFDAVVAAKNGAVDNGAVDAGPMDNGAVSNGAAADGT
jgi:16S rRNA (cytidine1402-2'-O)-methyltransferase